MHKKILVYLFLSLGLTASVSARTFPICIYGINKPEEIQVVKKAGFSCIQSYEQNPEKLASLAQQARKLGLKTVFYPQKVLGSSYEKQAEKWPMLAWYVVDEPDVSRWSRQQVIDIKSKTNQAWPSVETALVIGQGRTRIPFYDLTDNMMVDWYPVPHLELTSFGDNVAWTREGMKAYGAGEHPLWGVVQIFNWKEFKQYRPDHDRIGRFPTEDEIRFMSYDGILNGATGLFFFHLYSFGKPLPEVSPKDWQAVVNVIGELAKMRPIFEKGTLVENPVKVSAPLKMQSWKYKSHIYSILINRSNTSQAIPPQLLDKPYKRLFTRLNESLLVPYGVWILKK